MGVWGIKWWGGIEGKTDEIGGSLGVMWITSEMEGINENKNRKNTGNNFK